MTEKTKLVKTGEHFATSEEILEALNTGEITRDDLINLGANLSKDLITFEFYVVEEYEEVPDTSETTGE